MSSDLSIEVDLKSRLLDWSDSPKRLCYLQVAGDKEDQIGDPAKVHVKGRHLTKWLEREILDRCSAYIYR